MSNTPDILDVLSMELKQQMQKDGLGCASVIAAAIYEITRLSTTAQEAQGEFVHVGWMSSESYRRLIRGGNDSKGTVPVHSSQSAVSHIAVYIGSDQEPSTGAGG